MPELDVDGAVFCFPDGWEASKFDEWAYFRSVMSRIVDPLGRAPHGCDVVALHDGDLWLIETKGYSHPDAAPPSSPGPCAGRMGRGARTGPFDSGPRRGAHRPRRRRLETGGSARPRWRRRR